MAGSPARLLSEKLVCIASAAFLCSNCDELQLYTIIAHAYVQWVIKFVFNFYCYLYFITFILKLFVIIILKCICFIIIKAYCIIVSVLQRIH